MNSRYVSLTAELFDGIERGDLAGVASTVTLMEVCVRPWQLNATAIAAEYEALLINVPKLTILDVTRLVAREAARLRASPRMRWCLDQHWLREQPPSSRMTGPWREPAIGLTSWCLATC